MFSSVSPGKFQGCFEADNHHHLIPYSFTFITHWTLLGWRGKLANVGNNGMSVPAHVKCLNNKSILRPIAAVC